MITKYDNYFLNEKIYLKEKTKKVCILFLDLVKSSDKWTNNEKEMLSVLKTISAMFDKQVDKYNGMIIKSIGDAYMIKFNTLKDGLEFALFIQNNLKENPIKIKKDNISIRIGMCYGDVYEITQDIQNYKLYDYLGNTVNTAARIESKVCEDGEIAFASTEELSKDIEELLKDYKKELISFTNKGDEHKRSYRILNDIQKHIYKNIEELKGVDEIDVYKIKM
jgi:class 3 adenylate cyclase